MQTQTPERKLVNQVSWNGIFTVYLPLGWVLLALLIQLVAVER